MIFKASFGLIVEEVENLWSAIENHPTSLSDAFERNRTVCSGPFAANLDNLAGNPPQDMMHTHERRRFRRPRLDDLTIHNGARILDRL